LDTNHWAGHSIPQSLCETYTFPPYCWNANVTLNKQSIEVLSARLETDRSIIGHLLGAAQLWRALNNLIIFQIEILAPLQNLPTTDRWYDGAIDPDRAHGAVTEALNSLRTQQGAIYSSLMQETDQLIQRVTNLISIDEGHRSRDLSSSLRRLSWITVRSSSLKIKLWRPLTNM
jgi:hypothetical protein